MHILPNRDAYLLKGVDVQKMFVVFVDVGHVRVYFLVLVQRFVMLCPGVYWSLFDRRVVRLRLESQKGHKAHKTNRRSTCTGYEFIQKTLHETKRKDRLPVRHQTGRRPSESLLGPLGLEGTNGRRVAWTLSLPGGFPVGTRRLTRDTSQIEAFLRTVFRFVWPWRTG